jgi:hypothetical protein
MATWHREILLSSGTCIEVLTRSPLDAHVRETASCLALLAGALATTATAAIADGNAPMAVTVAPRSESSVFNDTTLVYLDGPIDADAPARLSRHSTRSTARSRSG